MNRRLADAALSLTGTPFRLHGRRPEHGLDCVGLVAEAMRISGHVPSTPQGYSLRSTSISRWLGHAEASGLESTGDEGEVVLCKVSGWQFHLLIRVPGGFVHAHAGLGKVVMLPAPLPWPIVAQWRLAEKDT